MKVKFIILGCGSSLGVPNAAGNWGNCNPREKKNYRTRCSALIKSKNKNILIDTSPDLRYQLLKNNISNIDRVLYSHKHADQVHGINDLRVFYLKRRKKIPIYADDKTKKYLTENFSYCFKKSNEYEAILQIYGIYKNLSFFDEGNLISIKSIPVQHGKIKSQSFIVNKSCAYVSDCSKIYDNDLKFFHKLKYFVIDCLRIQKHPSHLNLNKVLELVKIIKPKKTILTNLHSDLDYNSLLKILPKNIVPAYDGMSFII